MDRKITRRFQVVIPNKLYKTHYKVLSNIYLIVSSNKISYREIYLWSTERNINSRVHDINDTILRITTFYLN